MTPGGTILIVDDDPAARQLIKALLSRRGYELAFAASGAEALTKAAELMPDLILLDVMMPNMDGFEVCQRLRSNPLTAEVPIIMITALADRDSRLRGVEVGADDFVSKPFDSEELQARVQTIMRLNRFRLLRERARFEQLIQLLPDGIAIVDGEGLIRLTNPAMRTLLGGGEEIVSRDFLSFIEPDQVEKCAAYIRQAIGGAFEAPPVEAWFTRASTPGGRFLAEVRAVPMVWEGMSAAQVIVRDITVQKQAEEALHRYADEQAALYTLASAVTNTLNPEAVLSAALDVVLSVLRSETGWVMLVGPEINAPPRIVAWRNLPPDFLELESTTALSSCPVCAPILSGGGEPPAPVLVNACPRLPQELCQPAGTASHIVVPLCAGNEVMGIMEVVWRLSRPCSEADLMLLMTMGQQAGLALRNALLYQEARQVDRLRVLNELDHALAATLEIEEVAEIALRHLTGALGIPSGVLVFPSPPGNLHRSRLFTLGRGWVELEAEQSSVQALLRKVDNCERSVAIPAAELPELVGEKWGEHNLLVPVCGEEGGKIVALLLLGGRPASRPFTDDDKLLLEAAAGRIAQAIQSANLYHASLAQSMRLATLNAISAAAVSSLELDTVLQRILELITRALDAETSSILIGDPDERGLVFALSLTPNLSSLRGCRLSPGQGIAGWVAQHGQSLCVNDVRADPRWYEGVDAVVGFQTRSLLCAPLIHHDRVIGVVEIINKRTGRFTTEDLSLLEAASSIIAAALENARLYMTTKSHAAELALLNEVGLALTSTLDFSTVAHVALSQIQRRFSAELVALLQPDHQTRELRFVRALSRGKQVTIPVRLEPGEGIGGWAVLNRQAVLVEDVQRDPRFSDRIYRYLEIRPRGAMAVPLMARERIVGVIEVVAEEPGIYLKEDLDTLQAIASTLAVALENASLYGELRRLLHERDHIQAQLFHAEKMTVLGRLAASIAHEINNPLQAIQTYLTLAEEELAEGQEQERLRRYLSIVGGEIERISNIVGHLRDFYRPAREGMQPTYLHAVLENVLALTHRQLQHARITVERVWAEFLPEIQANPDHLKQVFLNLVLNAIDAMPEGGVLRITTAADRLRSLPAVRVEFSDTGAGMSPEVLAHLFEPFFTTKERGTGLGLSVSYDIIQAHNGQITVNSQPGVGTTYTILLPVDQPQYA
jgi:PAS domain S-box-containing protein